MTSGSGGLPAPAGLEGGSPRSCSADGAALEAPPSSSSGPRLTTPRRPSPSHTTWRKTSACEGCAPSNGCRGAAAVLKRVTLLDAGSTATSAGSAPVPQHRGHTIGRAATAEIRTTGTTQQRAALFDGTSHGSTALYDHRCLPRRHYRVPVLTAAACEELQTHVKRWLIIRPPCLSALRCRSAVALRLALRRAASASRPERHAWGLPRAPAHAGARFARGCT